MSGKKGFDSEQGFGKNRSEILFQSNKGAIGFYIEKFPREFRKGFFRSLDKRFFLILLFSFLINIGAVIYLGKTLRFDISDKTISKIQKQYAKLLLDQSFTAQRTPAGVISSEYQADAHVITSLSQWMNDVTFDIFESLDALSAPALSMPEAAAKESMGYTRDEMKGIRRSTVDRRMSSRRALSEEMASVGLLGVIAHRSNNLDYEYVQDLLEYASNNSLQLTEALSKLNTIEVPRYGNRAYLRMLPGDQSGSDLAELKGGRKSADKEVQQLVEKMQTLNTAQMKTVNRNIQYEKVESSYASKSEALNRVGVKRSSAEVVRTVRSHMRALQDCYKQQLKNDLNLKGKIVVRFTVNPAGEVIFASIVSSTLNNAAMENCIIKRILRWRDFSPCDPTFGNSSYRQSFKFGM
ncbi:MAG: AgmX/PglI C-terminal domain-containing protein [bacterium]|nr:AgmX/PglI C-terminal domain-containing protein [bacterium]